MNSSPTEALVMVQYMMAVMLGGAEPPLRHEAAR